MGRKLNDPTGLSIARNGTVFTLTWKDGDEQYWDLWGKGPIGRNAAGKWEPWSRYGYRWLWYPEWDKSLEKMTWTMNLNNYYPRTSMILTGLAMGVYASNEWFGDYYPTNFCPCYYAINKPPAPTASYTVDQNDANKTVFTFGLTRNQTSNWIVTDLEFQSLLKKDSNTTDGNSIDWSTGDYGQGVSKGTRSGADSFTWECSDNFDWTGYYSATRWFRVRARGPAGASAWTYVRRVHAIPAQATNSWGIATLNSDGGGYLVTVSWYGKSTPAHPIDYAVPEYAVVKPETTLTTKEIYGVTYKHVELIEPTNPSWTQGTRVKLSNGQAKVAQVLDRRLNDDEAIVVRGTHYFESKKNVSKAAYADGGFGNLAAPTNITVSSINPQTHRCTIGARNNSQVENTFLGIFYRTDSEPEGNICIGVIPPESSSAVVVMPEIPEGSSLSIGVKAYLADYSPITPRETGVTEYSLTNIIMTSSDTVWTESAIPLPPTNIALTNPSEGTIRVTWDWSWVEATDAELSWANRDDAWESTTEPSKYVVNNTNAGAWNIPGLEIGTWYVRVRFLKTVGESITYGTYSNTYKINLAGPPLQPGISLSETVISETGSVNCYWDYVSSDGTDQLEAEVCEADISNEGEITYGSVIAHTNTARHLTVYAVDHGWHYGERHYLAVRVTSESGEKSEWSVPEAIIIAEEIEVTITDTSLVERTETIEGVVTKFYDLTEMPLSVEATGCGASGMMTYIIERNKTYHMARPDDSDVDGYEGETVFITTVQTDDEGITITKDDLLGVLDDGAEYRLIVVAKDGYGQTAEKQLIFTVRWNHQAIIPGVVVEPDNDNLVMCITPYIPETYIRTRDTTVVEGKTYYIYQDNVYVEVQSPSGNPVENNYYELYTSDEGDTCDIYRLSADKPVLILENAAFGTKYVDPYPTLGEFGGHRIVYKTLYGDYITTDNIIAWKDATAEDGDMIDKFATIIDFDGEQLILPYNLSVSNKWAKDFTETKYLGGSIQGDWNPSISRTGTIKSTVVVPEDPDTVRLIRKLAAYPGVCHVRTPEGSSYSANVVVTDDREEKWVNKLSKVSLEITKVDDTGFDGMLYSDWIHDTPYE